MCVSLNFAFSPCLGVENVKKIYCHLQLQDWCWNQVFTNLFPLKWGLEREYMCLEQYVKEIGLWLLSSVVPLRSWVKSLALGGIRRNPKTLRGLPASHQLKMLFLYVHVLTSSFLSFVTSLSFLRRSTFSPLPFFLFPLRRYYHKSLKHLISFLFHGSEICLVFCS